MKAKYLAPSLLLLAAPGLWGATDSNQLLRYAQPAKYWNSESFHIGDGYMGASFYGKVGREVLELSEKSFWTGEPADGDWTSAGANPDCRAALPEIRRAVVEGRARDADRLTVERFLGAN